MTEVQSGGNRPDWGDLADDVKARIERLVGGRVVGSRPAVGGYSPGFASTLTTADGTRHFVKAMSDELTPGGPDLYRRERDVLRRLPPASPTAHLTATADDGEWIVLVYDQIDGRIPDPSRPDDLASMLDTYRVLADTLTPSPVELPAIEQAWGPRFDLWQHARADEPIGDHPALLWARDQQPVIRALAASWRQATAGTTLVHGDLRADNMLITDHGVVVLDWPEACIGAPWLDLVLALPSIGMFCGTETIETILATHPLTRDADDDSLDSALAALAGFFAINAGHLAPPGLPNLRAFQLDQAVHTLALLQRRRG